METRFGDVSGGQTLRCEFRGDFEHGCNWDGCFQKAVIEIAYQAETPLWAIFGLNRAPFLSIVEVQSFPEEHPREPVQRVLTGALAPTGSYVSLAFRSILRQGVDSAADVHLK